MILFVAEFGLIEDLVWFLGEICGGVILSIWFVDLECMLLWEFMGNCILFRWFGYVGLEVGNFCCGCIMLVVGELCGYRVDGMVFCEGVLFIRLVRLRIDWLKFIWFGGICGW